MADTHSPHLRLSHFLAFLIAVQHLQCAQDSDALHGELREGAPAE